jgi:hypothetical protein
MKQLLIAWETGELATSVKELKIVTKCKATIIVQKEVFSCIEEGL